MSFLPIVDRELRVRARQKSTYRFRLGGALAAVLIGGFLLATGQVMATPGTLGSGIFAVLGWLVFLYCLLEGARNTADCLSEEKRAGTLGLLFLTDLKGYDVVLGKLMATSLNSFYGLLAIFPPLAIPLVLGGVTGGEFWRLALALMNTLFFSLATGMSVSATSRLERRAWGGTIAIILFIAAVPPLLRWLPFLAGSDLMLMSPTTAFLGAFDVAYNAGPDDYWRSLLFIHLLSWAFLLAASCVLPKAWQDKPALAATPRLFFQRDPDRRHGERRWLLDRNPVAWLVERETEQRLYLWFFVLVAGVIGAGIWLAGGGHRGVAMVLFVGALVVHFLLAVWVASHACYSISEARDSGLLQLLLLTPLADKEIVKGQILAQQKFFLRPTVLLVLVEMILLIGQVLVESMSKAGTPVDILGLALVELWIFLFITDLFAVSRFGLWMGLTSRKPSQALGKTVLYILLLPMVTVLCCLFLGPFWPLLGMVKNLVFVNYAKEELRRQFRGVVAEHFASGLEGGGWTEPAPRKLPPQLPSVLPP